VLDPAVLPSGMAARMSDNACVPYGSRNAIRHLSEVGIARAEFILRRQCAYQNRGIARAAGHLIECHPNVLRSCNAL
jgi:hypothetical protein